MTRIVVAAVITASLAMCSDIERALAPAAEPWPRWEAHDPASTLDIDHTPWARFVAAYGAEDPSGVVRVAYSRVSAEDRLTLGAYIERLAASPVSRLSRDEQFAYWVNLYNALTVKVVLDHYPLRSILDVTLSTALFPIGPWSTKIIAVEGERLSLDDIEHRILRPIWRDPRIHYVVNCASLGCPNLPLKPIDARRREAALDAAAYAYVNHPRGARVDGSSVAVSSLFVWYQEDFGGDDAGVLAHLKRYALPPLADALATVERIADGGYDWSLNDLR